MKNQEKDLHFNPMKISTMILFGVWLLTAILWQKECKLTDQLEVDNKYLRSVIDDCNKVNERNKIINDSLIKVGINYRLK